MPIIDHYDNLQECIEAFGLFGQVVWLHGWTLGARFEWIHRDGHLLVYLSHNDHVLSTKKIAYWGKFRGYTWADS